MGPGGKGLRRAFLLMLGTAPTPLPKPHGRISVNPSRSYGSGDASRLSKRAKL
jgi:hypothetical protein